MYWTPWARLMKSITPKTSVKPAAIRNNRTPNCNPLRIWTRKSVPDMEPKWYRDLRSRGCAAVTAGEGIFLQQEIGRAAAGLRRGRRLFHQAVLGVRVAIVGEHGF